MSRSIFLREASLAYVMALKAGEDFFVDDVQFLLAEIFDSTSFAVRRQTDDQLFKMMDDGIAYEIMPGVMASVGTRGTSHVAKVAIDAPRSIRIDPGVSYHSHGGHTRA